MLVRNCESDGSRETERCSRVGVLREASSSEAGLERCATVTEVQVSRFWSSVSKGDDCWLWHGTLERNGYARFKANGRKTLAHRMSWMLSGRKIPPSMCVLHKCDVRHCVNPDHLFLGTYKDNQQDAMRKGRQTRGAKCGATLSESDVVAIRELVSEGRENAGSGRSRGVHRFADIARRFGVTQQTVRRIRNKTWQWLDKTTDIGSICRQ